MYIPTQEHSRIIVDTYGTPVFVTDVQTISDRAKKLLDAFSVCNTKIFYAIKANYNPHILQTIKNAGIFGIDAISPNEVQLALLLGYAPEQIIFTPSNPSDEEIEYVGRLGVLENLGSLSELRRFGKIFPSHRVSMRISPGFAEGENEKVMTGQDESKFGIIREEFSHVRDICKEFNLKLIGIHSHIGSGFYNVKKFTFSVKAICSVAKEFESIEFLDFGGGFGVQYHPDKDNINVSEFAKSIQDILKDVRKKTGQDIEVRIEPGKFLVAQSTVLLVRVTTIKQKGNIRFVGVDSGFHHLIRPAMYNAYHHVVNISNNKGEKEYVRIVGNVCETCDVFNNGIEMHRVHEGDILAILVTGAYGASMSSNYCLREEAAEVLVNGDDIVLTKSRQSFKQIMENFKADFSLSAE